MIPALADSGWEFLFYLFAVVLIASLYLAIRKARLNRLIRKNRMTDAKKFRFGAETSMAVSDEGFLCAVNFRLGTLTIDMKEIAEFEVLLGKFCIANAKASKNDGILFSEISGRLKPILAEEKLKEIALVIRLKNNKVFGIYLLKVSVAKRLIEAKQNNILRLFDTLEAAERKCKGK